MSKIKLLFFIILFVFNAVQIFAQPQPPGDPGDGGSNPDVGGGGAAIGDGYLLLLCLAIIYAMVKLYTNRNLCFLCSGKKR